MKICYENGHEEDGNWVENGQKEEIIENISVAELISKMKAFLDNHPDAYIQADSRLYLLEWSEEKQMGFSVDFIAERDEVD